MVLLSGSTTTLWMPLRYPCRVRRCWPGCVRTSQVTPAGVTKVGVPTTTSNGAGIGVAVLDTGIDFKQTDLAPASQSFSAFGGSCQDDNGHGTHVAGIISALNNTIGVVGV